MTDDDPIIQIAMAFPADPERRRALRQLVHMPMAVYADSVPMPCSECGEMLNVGPRVARCVRLGTARVCCPPCLVEILRQNEFAGIRNLGNKAIRHETDYE